MEVNECEEKLWNNDSFHYSLEDYDTWNIDKYWDREHFLIKLSKYLNDKNLIDNNLARNTYFLGNSINSLVYAHRSSTHAWTFETYGEDDMDYFIDRFNQLMRVL